VGLESCHRQWEGGIVGKKIILEFLTPGEDYLTALKAVFYYRQCLETTLVRDFVTFHFYFPFTHMTNGTFYTQADLGNQG
jgi:hypothetical protein